MQVYFHGSSFKDTFVTTSLIFHDFVVENSACNRFVNECVCNLFTHISNGMANGV